MYFKKKTYEEFLEDPLGVEYKRKQVFQDPRVREKIIKASLLKNRVEEQNQKFGNINAIQFESHRKASNSVIKEESDFERDSGKSID